MHLHNFLTKCDIIKLNRVSTDAIRLQLFLFCLRDIARDFLQNEQLNTFAIWDVLSKAFLSKDFPLRKTVKLTVDITSFAQLHGEPLYEA